MADNMYAGLFTSPEQIRQKRLDDLAKQQMMVSGSGGSWDQLLGQVAASGNLLGNQLTESMAGMFGMKTKEEDKAAQIQDMASNLNLETAQGKKLMARMLNNQGLTEQAMKMFDLAKAQEADELDKKVKERSLKNRDIKVIGSTRDLYGNVITKYGYWDPELGKVVELSPEEAKVIEDNDPTIKGGNALDYVTKQGFVVK